MSSLEFASATDVSTVPPTVDSVPQVVGSQVKVTARSGVTVSGQCLKAWRLRTGGLALTIRLADGSGVKHLSTVRPIAVLPARQDLRASQDLR